MRRTAIALAAAAALAVLAATLRVPAAARLALAALAAGCAGYAAAAAAKARKRPSSPQGQEAETTRAAQGAKRPNPFNEAHRGDFRWDAPPLEVNVELDGEAEAESFDPAETLFEALAASPARRAAAMAELDACFENAEAYPAYREAALAAGVEEGGLLRPPTDAEATLSWFYVADDGSTVKASATFSQEEIQGALRRLVEEGLDV